MKKNPRQLLGRRIRSVRKIRGQTQEELAEAAHIHPKYVSSLELGKENPTLDVLVRLAAALRIELIELFTFDHEVADQKALRKTVTDLLSDADEDRLRFAVKLLKAVVR